MKKGVTLAEVLITLGIIGVVAAMTMPTLINNINLTGENVGSVGSLIKKWTKKAVLCEAEKYKTPTEFFTKSAGAYDAAIKYKMMNNETFPWFYSKRMPPRWWSVKEHVFEESKNYKSWNEISR